MGKSKGLGCGGWLAVLVIAAVIASWLGETAGEWVIWIAMGLAFIAFVGRRISRGS